MARIRSPAKTVFLLLLLAGAGYAEQQTLRSRSGQFVVTGLPAAARFISYAITGRVDYVRLDPAVLAVSCERIKDNLLTELELQDRWKGTVYIRIFPVRNDNESVRFTSVRYNDGWSYGLELPEWITRTRLVQAVAQAVMSELANRKARDHAAELPGWLLEGMTAHLLANTPDELTLEPATRMVKRHGAEQSLAPVREMLRARSALTLDELSWPKPELLDSQTYANCAHLFVHELLNLRDGPRCMARMLTHLADHYNWQTTFLAVFDRHFRGLTDLDKWWALTIAHVAGRGPMSLWPFEHVLARLSETLSTPVQLRANQNPSQRASPAKLQAIMAEWDEDRLDALLAQKVSQLQAIRLRSPPEALAVIDDYLLTLQNRLRGRVNVADTIRRLNELDLQRARLNPPPPAQAPR